MKSKILLGAVAIAVLACFAFITIDKDEHNKKQENTEVVQTQKLSGITLDDNTF